MMRGMSDKINEQQLESVRGWAAQGIDLNGIQKKLREECGVHLTYMEVRFLLLDHGIEIATEPEPTPKEEKPEFNTAQDSLDSDSLDSDAEGSAGGRVQVTLDDLQLPGTLLSGKAVFPGGASGSWLIDQLGRFGWSELKGHPSPQEMQDFQQELTALLSRG